MKRKLYYTVYFDTYDDGSQNGNKTITVYTIEENYEPTHWFEVEGTLQEKSEELIQNYLDDNGYGDEEFEMRRL